MALGKFDENLRLDDDGSVQARGDFRRDAGDNMKALSVRVCQASGGVKGHTLGEGPFGGNAWTLRLDQDATGDLRHGEATASAVLTWTNDDGDLFAMTWTDCVHLVDGAGGAHAGSARRERH